MDRAECCAVYIDDRVRAERWVRRNSSDASTGSSGSFILADEPEMLQSNVEMLLEISKQGMFPSSSIPQTPLLSTPFIQFRNGVQTDKDVLQFICVTQESLLRVN